MRKIITYAIDNETGLIWSRMDSEVAVPVLDYDGDMGFKLEKHSVMVTIYADLIWTKKIPVEIKNEHRQFWGMKVLSK